MSVSNDPVKLIEESRMSNMQIVVVVIAVLLNALDGFDLLSISFAAPGIAGEWGVAPTALGIVLSMELVGMGIGALILGGFADNFGRRNAALFCLILMLAGMLGVPYAGDTFQLSIYRIVTGIGLGGMLSTCNALVAEYSSLKRRKLCISLMVMGFSLGGVVGGFIASKLLGMFDWRAVFYFGSAVTAICIPLVFFLVPEPVQWLVRKQPVNALKSVNKSLAKMGHGLIEKLPSKPVSDDSNTGSIAEIFNADYRKQTIFIALVYVLHALTFYFPLKWIPTLVVQMGYHPSTAGFVLTWANVGGAIGGIAFGFLAQRFNLKHLFFTVLVMSGVTVIIFGNATTSLNVMTFFAAVNGFFCVSGLAASYASLAQIYPTHSRAFGTGFTMSVGRGGAIFSPILAGFLFSIPNDVSVVSVYMALGSLLAAFFLLFLRYPQSTTDSNVSFEPATTST